MNTMIRLKNLKKNNVMAECDIIPEDSTECGHIVVNLGSGELEDCVLPKGYEWCRNHVNHAQINLLELSKKEMLPDEYKVMWY